MKISSKQTTTAGFMKQKRLVADIYKPINELSTREHVMRHHMKPGIDNFILFKCVCP
jgi:hypothetical protein